MLLAFANAVGYQHIAGKPDECTLSDLLAKQAEPEPEAEATLSAADDLSLHRRARTAG